MYDKLITFSLIVCYVWPNFGVYGNVKNVMNLGNMTARLTSRQDKRSYCSSNENYVWCLPDNYTSEENPFQHADMVPNKPLPWNNSFEFNIKNIDKIDDKAQSVSLSMYFSVKWFDPRLVINETHKAWSEVKLGPPNEVTISSKNLLNLWYPELEIYGIESFRAYKVLREMSGLRIKKDKTINYELKVEVTISCQMNFDNYPLDEQDCLFQVGSYYGSNETIQCESNWTYDATRQKNIQHVIELKSLPHKDKTVTLKSGNYAVCGFSIHLHRKRMQNFVQIYMPSFMFVVASWISFVVKPDMVPGRMALLVSILLIQLNLFNNSKDKGPVSNSNINALDLYLVFSMFLVFSALMEFAVVLVLMKVMPSWTVNMVNEMTLNKKFALNRNNVFDEKDTNELTKSINSQKVSSAFQVLRNKHCFETTENITRTAKETTCQLDVNDVKDATEYLCNKIDFISLSLAPIIFIIFHIVYFIVYQ